MNRQCSKIQMVVKDRDPYHPLSNIDTFLVQIVDIRVLLTADEFNYIFMVGLL